MGYNDTQQVCLNGHQITDRYDSSPDSRKEHCEKCGKKTIKECPECGVDIKGAYHSEGVILFETSPVPEYCHKCGSPYPWTLRKKESKNGEPSSELDTHLRTIRRICSRFHIVAQQLCSRHENRTTLEINDEYDVQDLFHSLLRLSFDDVRPEEHTPSYAGKSSRMDFLMKGEEIVVEVKKTRSGLGASELGDQLIVDIDRYKEHPSCKTLICFVYDPDSQVNNPIGLENDLSRHEDGLAVEVIVTPKGI